MLVTLSLLLGAPALGAQDPGGEMILATTTSVRDAGLLDELLPMFEARTGIVVKVVAVGSGQAMELGRRGEADLLLVHAPAGERAFVEAGYGIDRRALMHNDFVLVGPAADPAGIRGRSAVAAMRAISEHVARFVSRGDRSGTHAREQRLWEAAGIEPSREWRLESGQGMGATLVIADQLSAYTLSDIGTFLAHRGPLELEILVQGDSLLRNPYHVIRINPERFPGVNHRAAAALADYLVEPETQRRIAAFGRERFGRPLFVPDAVRFD